MTSRTLRRDVDKLRSLGYPIHSTPGTEGGYQLGAGSTMPPLLLDDAEAVAVALGLRHTATGTIEGVEDASVRALAKIEQILPPRLGRRVAALQAVVVTPVVQPSSVDARTLTVIASACRDHQVLRFRYHDRAGSESSRSVEPHRLVNLWQRWYLVAWDSGRSDWRTFRVDRIERRLTLGSRFTPRPLPARDLAEYVSQGGWRAAPCRARIKMLVNAEVFADRLYPGFGLIEPIDGQSCWLDTGASSYESLAMHLALLGVDFEVTGPPELQEQVRRMAERYRRAAQESP